MNRIVATARGGVILPWLLLFALSCGPARIEDEEPPIPSVALPPELDRVLRDYERAWQAHSVDSLGLLFSTDGLVLTNNRPAMRGRAAAKAAYTNIDGGLSLRAISFSVVDTVGYIVGTFSSKAGEPDIGKFMIGLRRDPGGPWEITAAMDNSVRP